MQDIATKVEGSQLTAAEFNQIPSEIENAITSTGQTLTNADVRQLVKAIAIYAAKGDFYTSTGTADAITLNPVSQMQAPTAYYLGMRIRFIATADNTGPVTIAVGTLGTVSLYNNEGEDLATGDITSGIEYSATYDGSAFRLFAAITEALNRKVDLDGGNYRGSGLEEIISSESNKIKLVSVLPVEPEEGVLYCIPEV